LAHASAAGAQAEHRCAEATLPRTDTAAIEAGHEAMAAGRWSVALRMFRCALVMRESAPAYAGLGAWNLRAHRADAAAAAFERAIELDPAAPEHPLELAWAYAVGDDFERAHAWLHVARLAGASASAADDLERYITLAPDRAGAGAMVTVGATLGIVGGVGVIAGVIVRVFEDNPPCVLLCSWGGAGGGVHRDNTGSTVVLAIAAPMAVLGIALLVGGAVWGANNRDAEVRISRGQLSLDARGLRLEF
jgi:tetratricopeptide (TPR) repeat protein